VPAARVDLAAQTNAPWFSGPTRVFDLDDSTRWIMGGVPGDHTGYLVSGFLTADTGSGRDFASTATAAFGGFSSRPDPATSSR
jgi:hypothetical protein